MAANVQRIAGVGRPRPEPPRHAGGVRGATLFSVVPAKIGAPEIPAT